MRENNEKPKIPIDELMSKIKESFDVNSERFQKFLEPFKLLNSFFLESEEVFNKLDDIITPAFQKAKKVNDLFEKYQFILKTFDIFSGSKGSDRNDRGFSMFFPDMVS